MQVINTVITKDHKEACKLESETGKALRDERIRLLKEKLQAEGEQVEDLPGMLILYTFNNFF